MRKYEVNVKFVKGSLSSVAHFLIEYVKANKNGKSILLFTNTRDEAEYLSTVLKNQNEFVVDVHHGSLSKDVRSDTEGRLRAGSAGIVVCTSSLELGLDIGSIDEVIHYGSPRQVSKLIQRIGRSRHTKRASAKGMIITNTFDDFMESLSIVNRVNKSSIELQSMHMGCLDVLAHNIVGLTLQIKTPLPLVAIFDTFKLSY